MDEQFDVISVGGGAGGGMIAGISRLRARTS